MRPVVVIGPPRSGTSVIARLLQEELGVMMDEGPIAKRPQNPDGLYEDKELIRINEIAMRGWKPEVENKMNMQWATQFAAFVANRMQRYDRWGFKDPRMVALIPWMKQFLIDAIWIVPIRKQKDIAKSLITKFGMPSAMARLSVQKSYKLIKDGLGRCHEIDLTYIRKDNDLVCELQEIING